MENNLQNLFNLAQNYNEFNFEIFKVSDGYQLNKKAYMEAMSLLGFGTKRIESRCNRCNKRYPFSVEIQSLKLKNSYFEFSSASFEMISYSCIMYFAGKYSDSDHKFNKDNIMPFVDFLRYTFSCTNCSICYQMYIRVSFDGVILSIQKIGQYPSQIDVEGFDFDIYKTILNRFNAYIDYKKSHLCYSEGFYVGSFAYLRRVFEKMLMDYVGKQKLEDNHVETKIKAVKNKFSPDILDLLKPLYELLSISIHELNEEKSKEYYEYLFAVIEIQLEYERTNKDKENKLKKLSTKINEFKSDISLNK